MATNKNITMKQYNGVDYDTLYPKTIASQIIDLTNEYYNKTQTLSDATKILYGLANTVTPDDIFMSLKVPAGYYGFKIVAKFSDNTPAANLRLRGVLALDLTETPYTDSNGICFVLSASATPTLDFTNYIGIVSKTEILQSTTSSFTTVNLSVDKDAEMRLTTTSGEYDIYSEVVSVDLCAVGGGGGGGYGRRSEQYPAGAGGGGYVNNLLAKTGLSKVSFTIGAGGSSRGNFGEGGDGGTTIISVGSENILTANGGKGGTYSSSYGNSGGVGNGNGGYSGQSYTDNTNGKDGTTRVFNEESLPLPGGGGGGANYGYTIGLGGSDFGGNGGYYNNSNEFLEAQNGKGPGGGGGAIYAPNNVGVTSGFGYKGGVYYRARFS